MPVGKYPHRRFNQCKIHGPLTAENAILKKQYGKGREGQWQFRCRACHSARTRAARGTIIRPPRNEQERWERILTSHNLSLNRGMHATERSQVVVYVGKKEWLEYWQFQPTDNPWHPQISDGYIVMQLARF